MSSNPVGTSPKAEPSLPATFLGSASAEADQDIAEVPRTELAKAEVTPDHVAAMDGADEDAVPAVAQGDVEHPVDPGLQDLGWSEDPKVPNPVLQGMINEDVWTLVRRFNKQTYHAKRLEEEPQGGIDMNIADKDAFTPDKLRATLERIYMSMGLGAAGLFKHVARIRSWKEQRRTALFFVVYLVGWVFDYLGPIFSALIMLLLVSPRSRRILFPPAPLAAISAKTGEARVPKAGHLGSESLTGAAESYKGEAVENEASNLVGSVAHMAVSTAIGNDQNASQAAQIDEGQDDSDEDGVDPRKKSDLVKMEDSVPDPSAVTLKSKAAHSKAGDDKNEVKGDHSAAPVQSAVWGGAQPLLHALEDLVDTWERFGNALSPTPPFAQHGPRVKIASIVAPLFLLSLVTTPYMVYKGATFGAGFGFFAQPLFDMMKFSDFKKLLDEKIPDWPRYLELRNSVLKGVPTNAQLTITLLRIGEANKCPLPPPPPAASAPDATAVEGHEMAGEMPEEYVQDMKDHASEVEQTKQADGSAAAAADSTEKPKKGSKFMAFIKGTTKAGVNTALGTNRVKAEAGFQHARQRVGVVKKDLGREAVGDGPASFRARYKGKRGLVLISTTATTPCVSFEKELPAHAKAALSASAAFDDDDKEKDSKAAAALKQAAEKARPTPLFSIAIDEIVSCRKIGGLGFKGKLLVGWALESAVADGIEIITEDGQTHTVTAMPRRDEVWNRLVSMGKQRWELW